MKKLLILSLAILATGLTGCSTRGTFATAEQGVQISSDATFENAGVEDASGYIWGDDEEKLDLKGELSAALDEALEKEGLNGTDYRIVTTITQYEPGNAFKRWLMPGFGATKLHTRSEVFGQDGTLIATIPVERYVGFGGAFSIGAWKTVIDDVAKEIVEVLKKATTR